jgi:hypothetical protein
MEKAYKQGYAHEHKAKPVGCPGKYGVHATGTKDSLPHTTESTTHISPAPLHQNHHYKEQGNHYKKRRQKVIHGKKIILHPFL